MKHHKIILLAAIFPLVFALFGRDCSSSSSVNKASGPPSSNPSPSQTTATVTKGIWGGTHVRLEVSDNGGQIEYDCAHGTISESIKLDSEGRFRVKGAHVQEHGGPIRDNETPNSRAVEYSGIVKGKIMTLTVKLTGASESVGTFKLTAGAEGELFKCR